jgi:uncharacterized protein (DUF924 family)
MISPDDVLDFWFAGNPGAPRPVWFARSEAFDVACQALRQARDQARDGALDHWTATPRGTLALLILLDQLSRNLYRGSPEAFAADAKARAMAGAAIDAGHDRCLGPVERVFLYLPFEHAEDAADQDLSVRLFESLRGSAVSDRSIDYAYRHRTVIRRFGRFPHRNAALGRANTAEEEAYLAQAGAGF